MITSAVKKLAGSTPFVTKAKLVITKYVVGVVIILDLLMKCALDCLTEVRQTDHKSHVDRDMRILL